MQHRLNRAANIHRGWMKSSRWPPGKYVNHTHYACRSEHLSKLRKSNRRSCLLCSGLYFLMFSNRFFVDDEKGNSLFTHIYKSLFLNLNEIFEYFALLLYPVNTRWINRSYPSQFNIQTLFISIIQYVSLGGATTLKQNNKSSAKGWSPFRLCVSVGGDMPSRGHGCLYSWSIFPIYTSFKCTTRRLRD